MDLSISHGNSSIRLITIYRPTRSKKNCATVGSFFQFSSLLETVNLTPSYVLINGDYNFHLDVIDDNNASAFRDLLESTGLKQHVEVPTHRSGHTLDLVTDRQDDNVLSAFTVGSDLPSDHYAIFCCVAFSRPKPGKAQFTFRKFRDIEMDSWKKDILNSLLYTSTPDLADVNSLLDQCKVLSDLFDKHAPERSRSITVRPNAPWFNDSLRAMKSQRRTLERKYLSTRLEVHRQMYRDQCQIYTAALHSAKSTYYKAKTGESDNNQLFSMVNGLFKVKRLPPLPSHVSCHSLAEDFGEFFHSKIEKIRDRLHTSNAQSTETSVLINPSPCPTSLSEFTEVSETYIRELIDKSKPKSCCLDPVPTRILKQSVDVLAHPITKVVNASLMTGEFPSCLKKGTICPSINQETDP